MTSEPIELHTAAPTHGDAGGCQCGHDDEGPVTLDVRPIPHAIRHATVFGALSAVAPGFSLDLVAPHDPVPLLLQVEERLPGQFTTAYVVSGPEAWTIRFTRSQ
ncbi:MAG: hemerythrin [Actinobacteria bacterium HGW-Actinobacteria-4]|nr:MAG: hemerythrin [Actinobacteria bacterium HGW-Actinobacteria-4]